MSEDRQGNRLSGATPEAVSHFDQAVSELNLYRGDPVATVDRAIAAAPTFVMAHVLKAWLHALATEPAAAAEARRIVERARALHAHERELSHLAILERLLNGNWVAAAVAMDFHNMRHPRDLVGLQSGHVMDFFRANARDMRDRIARALPRWSPAMPGHSVVLGMYAFGLEEAGDYARAEAMGREALDGEPLDCWAHHAVTHVMEMQGRVQDGIGWMIAREPHWAADDNFFKIHNWWHRALYHLDLGQVEVVLRLYDGPVRGSRSVIALDLVDASALLWRLHLSGHDVGDRWEELSRCWDQHADGRLYPFNDWHAVMAYLGAGREGELDRVIAALERSATGNTDTAAWAGAIALPLIDGFVAFWRGKYQRCAERLHATRFIVNRFGGSHAQRDVIDWTLTEAAVRGGLADLAEALAHERLALKPHSPLNRRLLGRAHGNGGARTSS